MPHLQIAGQNHNIKIANKSLTNVMFRYLRMTVTEITHMKKLRADCIQVIPFRTLSSHLLSKMLNNFYLWLCITVKLKSLTLRDKQNF
jgi:hypothetical protein